MLTLPIPRFLWAGKPNGISCPIGNVVGLDATTVTAGFLGDAYLDGLFVGILVYSFLLGGIFLCVNIAVRRSANKHRNGSDLFVIFAILCPSILLARSYGFVVLYYLPLICYLLIRALGFPKICSMKLVNLNDH
jgi:hypothetical protein